MKTFKTPEFEVEKLEITDVITASGDTLECTTDDDTEFG